MATAETIAGALCARWGLPYGPAADMATAGTIQRELEAAIQTAIAAEREACAKIADEGAYYGTAEGAEDMARTIARLIRNRKEEPA